MKTNFKTVLILLILAMVVTLLPTTVRAEYSATVSITPDKTKVQPGDTVNLVVELKDIVDAGTGVTDMQGKMEYDKTFFESITATQGSYTANEETNTFILGTGTPITEEGEQFAVLQLKVSSKATGTSRINFTELITSNGEAEPSSPAITLDFEVEEEGNNGANTTPSENTTPSNNTTPENTTKPGNNIILGNNTTKGNNTIQNNNITANTAKQNVLPKAGTEKEMLVGIVVLIGIGIASYVAYKKYQKV